MNVPPIDARTFLESLVGQSVYTIDRGDYNRIIAIADGDVIVGTKQSAAGARVPISYVQEAADRVRAETTLRIHPDELGHRRSSFVGAVLAIHPEIVGLVQPQRIRLRGVSSLRTVLAVLLDSVQEPRSSQHVDKNDPFYGRIVHGGRDEVAALVGDERSYKTQGSAGQGNWAEPPWVAVFDRNVTQTATRGYYVVYLFRRDGQGVYLSLNQGATAVERLFGRRRYEEVLESRARTYADYLADADLTGLALGRIDLGGGRPPLTPGYEAASVAAIYYPATELPSDPDLEADLQRFLRPLSEAKSANSTSSGARTSRPSLTSQRLSLKAGG